MAFDGIVIANLTRDMKQKLEGGKIAKIAQPEKDELLFTIKNNKETFRLLVSASASLPLVYFTEKNEPPSDCPEFLYAASQTHRNGTDHCHQPAGTGAYHPHGDRTSG